MKPILAANWSPVLVFVMVVPLVLGAVSLGAVIVNSRWGRRKW